MRLLQLNRAGHATTQESGPEQRRVSIEVTNTENTNGLLVSLWPLLPKYNPDRHIGRLVLLSIPCGHGECKAGEVTELTRDAVATGRTKIKVVDEE